MYVASAADVERLMSHENAKEDPRTGVICKKKPLDLGSELRNDGLFGHRVPYLFV